ncbi:hypothetical protein Tsubulata_031005 [Turnera subulata]|uniref:ACT domain-containing protein ACR n=1 Tax=Turnera subulata TaxID=218843 RepID=A0A9Q0J7Z2_9ROSI|nr:hypothetical protein Tsubulata_031005 [Turnera subulata]
MAMASLTHSIVSSSSSSSLFGFHSGSTRAFAPLQVPSPPVSPVQPKLLPLPRYAVAFSRKQTFSCGSTSSPNAGSPASLKSELDDDYVPMPIVMIDQDSDSDATIVQVSFGDRLGALIDTMRALKDLGLDVTKGTVTTEGSVKQTKLFITRFDGGRKVEDPDMLEGIRLTIINNLLKYHPESSEQLALGEAFGIKAPQKKGLIAKDKLRVSYRGAALNSSLSQVLVNCLRYYLRRPETDIDSY